MEHEFLFLFSDVVKVLEDGDLQTLGLLDYDKRLKHSFTAHPKVDPFIFISFYSWINCGGICNQRSFVAIQEEIAGFLMDHVINPKGKYNCNA